MNTVKRVAKAILDSGYRLAAKAANTFYPPVIVLAYHRIADLEHDPQVLAVSRKNFADHLAWLRENDVEALRFDEFWPKYFKSAQVCITFDDGYADNYRNALPILEQYNIPAAFFISSGAVQSGRAFWWDVIEPILYDPLPAGPPPAPFNSARSANREQLYQSAHSLLFGATPEQQEEWLDALCAWLGVSRNAKEDHLPMTPAEVATLSRHSLAILGAHTHSHPRLAQLSRAQQKQEIAHSLELLEQWSGKRPRTLAYPFGSRSRLGIRKDYNNDSLGVCRELGITRAAANYPGQVRPWTNPLAVPRHLVRNWDKDTFARYFLTLYTKGYF